MQWVKLREREPVSSQMEEILNSFLDALGEKDPWILEAGAGEKNQFQENTFKGIVHFRRKPEKSEKKRQRSMRG